MIAPAKLILPLGTPDWITPELISDTLDVWQPYYDEALTVADAVDMLMAMGNVGEIIAGSTKDGGA